METGQPRDRIRLSQMQIDCRIGVLPGEADRPQPLRVGLEVELDLQRASETDELAHTLDYGELVRVVREAAARPHGLLEALAGSILRATLGLPGVEAAEVTLSKTRPPLGEAVGPVEVVLRRRREERS